MASAPFSVAATAHSQFPAGASSSGAATVRGVPSSDMFTFLEKTTKIYKRSKLGQRPIRGSLL
jgi:hypothetical protein